MERGIDDFADVLCRAISAFVPFPSKGHTAADPV